MALLALNSRLLRPLKLSSELDASCFQCFCAWWVFPLLIGAALGAFGLFPPFELWAATPQKSDRPA